MNTQERESGIRNLRYGNPTTRESGNQEYLGNPGFFRSLKLGIYRRLAHRVDVSSDEVCFVVSEKEVFAAEWDDSGLGGTAREGCHSVGVESAAGDDMTGGQHWLGVARGRERE